MKNKFEGIITLLVSVVIMMPLFFSGISFVLLLGMLKLPKLFLMIFSVEKVGPVYSILNATYYTNLTVALLTIVIIVVNVVINVRWRRKYGCPIQVTIVNIGLVVVIMGIFLFEGKMGEEIQRYQSDISRYESGEVSTYYGTLTEGKKEEMAGPFYTEENPIYAILNWRINDYSNDEQWSGLDSRLRSTLSSKKDFNIEMYKEYKVTYLEKTRVICDVVPFDRKSLENSKTKVALDGFKDLKEGDDLHNLVNKKGKYNYRGVNLGNFLRSDKNAKIKYLNLDINNDELVDYLVVAQSEKNKEKSIMILLNTKLGYLDGEVLMNFWEKDFNMYTLESKNYMVNDICIEVLGDNKEYYFKFDGLSSFKKF